MFNKQNEAAEEGTEIAGFPITPSSIKLFSHELVVQWFRVSVLVHDILIPEPDQREAQETDTRDAFRAVPKFDAQYNSIFEQEIYEEKLEQMNLLMRAKDVNVYATDLEELKEEDRFLPQVTDDKLVLSSDDEEEARIQKK